MADGYAIAGLVMMILGWGVQVYISAVRRIFALSLKFVAIFVVGCLLLFIGSLRDGHILVAILYVMCGFAACLAGYHAKRARR